VRNLKARLGKADADKDQTCKEDVRRASAERGAQLRAQLEQQPVAASLTAAVMSYLPLGPDQTLFTIAFVVNALYGVVAGMLVPRFGILKAVAIPIVPAGVLAFLIVIIIRFIDEPVFPADRLQDDVNKIATSFVQGFMVACLAFWLHSKWLRKRQMN